MSVPRSQECASSRSQEEFCESPIPSLATQALSKQLFRFLSRTGVKEESTRGLVEIPVLPLIVKNRTLGELIHAVKNGVALTTDGTVIVRVSIHNDLLNRVNLNRHIREQISVNSRDFRFVTIFKLRVVKDLSSDPKLKIFFDSPHSVLRDALNGLLREEKTGTWDFPFHTPLACALMGDCEITGDVLMKFVNSLFREENAKKGKIDHRLFFIATSFHQIKGRDDPYAFDRHFCETDSCRRKCAHYKKMNK